MGRTEDNGRHEDDGERERRRDRRDRVDDETDEEETSGDQRKKRKRRERDQSNKKRDDEEEEDSESEEERRRERKRRHKRKDRKRIRRRRLQLPSLDEDENSDDDNSSDDDDSRSRRKRQRKKSKRKDKDHESSSKSKKKKVVNEKLLAKLAARGETLEEREARRAERRAARITATFGYTADDNPFNDPNLHETFVWQKKEQQSTSDGAGKESRQGKQDHIFDEIEKVRRRRKEREDHYEEMERIRAEENRMKELENYDDWARKEEEFHRQQQRQRSAIRLVEGREKPVDVLAKNLLLFGLSDEERQNRAAVKYQEKYNAMNELQTLEAELQEPHEFLKILKLEELRELLKDIEIFCELEREAVTGACERQHSPILTSWENLRIVAEEEIRFLEAGGENSTRASTIADIRKLFEGQSAKELESMHTDVQEKIRKSAHVAASGFGNSDVVDMEYWKTVLKQLQVHQARLSLSEFHNKMLVRQLERLEQRKRELKNKKEEVDNKGDEIDDNDGKHGAARVPSNVPADFGDLEEELGLTDEVAIGDTSYAWEDRFRPRKPRFFNRVKSGYDWNKYNQTHYDQDNPPPKTVQGYKFNIFYPDLIDKTKTPRFVLEPADTDEFCIIRFKAGPPYEDIAFKIINREWNRSRKRGFKSTFERGVLSLYFNFKTHWYRR